ncbi:unnamed protein product [Schistosoma guineensis]|nr:unnamed protein product [Schistosoma guineensis]
MFEVIQPMTLLNYHKLLTTSFRGYSVKKLLPKYDIIIVGGGMVGFGLAAVAAASKFLGKKSILLLESSGKKSINVEKNMKIVLLLLTAFP